MSSDSSSNTHAPNHFTQGSLATLFAKTALPVIFVMTMNGLLAVIDAMFLGVYVGANALAAVTLMFPIYMLTVALSTLVSSGMSSLLARHLGGHRIKEAQTIFAGAHGLALTVSALFIIAFLLGGHQITQLVAGGSDKLAAMGYAYLAISIFSTPLFFILSLHSDALRNEGRAPMMAAMSLLVTIGNILFDYILIVPMHMGVIGSALGTTLAQALALLLILGYRSTKPTVLPLSTLWHNSLMHGWQRILTLGAPQSLNFIGLSIVSTAIITSLQMVAAPHYAETISAYGIITRILTFVFLPLMGLSLAFQSITGNNYGAELWHRSNDSLRIGLVISTLYCLLAEVIMINFPASIGQYFVDNQAVISEVTRIIPMMVALYFLAGPMLITATYFQAIGDAGRAAILGLAKPYFFSLPLIFLLPLQLGEQGIWLATPTADTLLFITAALVLMGTAKRYKRKWGLFTSPQEIQS